MDWFKALILGLVQGATEFFPISSSAHLKLLKLFFGLTEEGLSPFFDLCCHGGTTLALILYFWKEIKHIWVEERKKVFIFFCGLVPLIPFYFLLKPLREAASAPHFLGPLLIVTAALLFIGNRFKEKKTEPSARQAVLVGVAQACALIPGISRSGATIAAARALGWPCAEAVRFSFLLAIPAILGGMFLETIKVVSVAAPVPVGFCVLGFATSFITGLSVISFALRLLQKGNLAPFAWYCLFLGGGVSVWLF